jgi:hypothetical protein
VKSFRTKDDPYFRMTSKYELKKDAQDRGDMNYEVLMNRRNNHHIQNAIKACQRDRDKIEVNNNKSENEDYDDIETGEFSQMQDEQQKNAKFDSTYKLKRK